MDLTDIAAFPSPKSGAKPISRVGTSLSYRSETHSGVYPPIAYVRRERPTLCDRHGPLNRTRPSFVANTLVYAPVCFCFYRFVSVYGWFDCSH